MEVTTFSFFIPTLTIIGTLTRFFPHLLPGEQSSKPPKLNCLIPSPVASPSLSCCFQMLILTLPIQLPGIQITFLNQSIKLTTSSVMKTHL